MLGKAVSARVITPAGRFDRSRGFLCNLPFGEILDTEQKELAFYIGSDAMDKEHEFEGRVIALSEPAEEGRRRDFGKIWIVAKDGERYINTEIESALNFEDELRGYKITRCVYETSAGAIVYRRHDGEIKFLLVKNKNANWGFPKGHIEKGETKYDAARREVLEETGVHVDIHLGFEGISTYSIRDRIHKKVSLFVGTTDDDNTVIQEAEIAAYDWLPFEQAAARLKFDNDVKILIEAEKFLIKMGFIEDELPDEEALSDRFYRSNEAEGIEIHTV